MRITPYIEQAASASASAGQTQVVNLYREPFDIYIGRPGRGFDGLFGNPFNGPDRDSSILAYKAYLDRRALTDLVFAQALLDLRGRRLGCFCKPLACHGDVIVGWLETSQCSVCGAQAGIAFKNRDTAMVMLYCSRCYGERR